MSLGKEGPYVHLATCVGNITSRFFPLFMKMIFEKQILSASASAGVALHLDLPWVGFYLFLKKLIITYHLINCSKFSFVQ